MALEPAAIGVGWFLTLSSFGCAGQTGLGKSTSINTLFASHLIDSKGRFASDEEVRQTTEIHPVSHSKSFIQARFAVGA
jgi:septin family protein